MDINGLDLYDKFIQSRKTMPTKKVLILDAMNLYIRSFCADPKINYSGIPIGGIFGFINGLAILAKLYKPTEIYVAFDGKDASGARRKIYPEYKANRGMSYRFNRPESFGDHIDEEESFKYQLQVLGEFLDTLPVLTLAPDGIEADDSIAFIHNHLLNKDPDIHVIVVTGDRDMLQLVSERCWIYSPVNRTTYTIQEISNEYGLHHENFGLVKIFAGDTSDNISGVMGIGVKKLLRYIPELATRKVELSEILFTCGERLSDKKPLKFYTSILESMDVLKRNEKLVYLDGSILTDAQKLLLHKFVNKPHNEADIVGFRKLFAEHGLGVSHKTSDEMIVDIMRAMSGWAT